MSEDCDKRSICPIAAVDLENRRQRHLIFSRSPYLAPVASLALSCPAQSPADVEYASTTVATRRILHHHSTTQRGAVRSYALTASGAPSSNRFNAPHNEYGIDMYHAVIEIYHTDMKL